MGTLLRSLRQLFSSPSRAYPLWLLIGIAVIICFFVFKEVPDRQSEILATDFRLLAFESDKIKSAVDAYVTMVTKAAAADSKRNPKLARSESANRDAQIEGDSPYRFVECPQAPENREQTATRSHRKQTAPGGKVDEPKKSSAKGDLNKAQDGAGIGGTDANTISLQILSKLGSPIAFINSNPYCFEFPLARTPIDGFIMEHIDRFDNIALALSNGEVLYQIAEGRFRLGNIGNLLEEAYRPKDKGAPIAPQLKRLASKGEGAEEPKQPQEVTESADWRQINYSTLLHADFETDPYEILVQPIPVPVLLPDPAREQVAPLLIGIKSRDKLTSEARRLEATELAPVVVVLLLAILVLWPILKLWKMPATDGFKSRELLFLGSTIVAVMALITLGLLFAIKQFDYSRFDQPEKSIARELRNLARRIQSNMEGEIGRALTVLDKVTESEELSSDLKKALSAKSFQARGGILHTWKGLFATSPDYPWLDQIAWADADGKQLVKWSVSEHASGQTNPRDFPFFSKLQTRDMWRLKENGPEFLLTPIIAPLTGKYVPILWKRYKRADNREIVGAISSNLISVTNVILPAHFGFAIIDDHEKIQFHSDPSGGLSTNLLNGVRPPRSVFAAVSNFVRTKGSLEDAIHSGNLKGDCCFSQQYLGTSVMMYPSPLWSLNPSWTLITWYDLEQRSLPLAKVFGWSMVLVLLYTFATALVGWVFDWAARRMSRSPEEDTVFRYLPSERNLANWIVLILCFLALAIGYTVIIWLGSGRWISIYVCVMPFTVGIVAWSVMKIQTKRLHERIMRMPWGGSMMRWMESSASLGMASVAMVVLGAVLLGAFPALSFAGLFWEDNRKDYSNEASVEVWRSLRERCHYVKDELEALRNDEDLRNRRLNMVAWDRYTGATLDVCDSRPNVSAASTLDPPGSYPFPGWPVPAVFSFGMIIIGTATWAMLRWRFQWGHHPPRELYPINNAAVGKSKLVIAPPWEDVVAGSTVGLSPESYTVCRAAEIRSRYYGPSSATDFLILSGLEQTLENRDAAIAILPVLEDLLLAQHPTLIVTSAVDPLAWLVELNLSKDELSRWLRVLNSLGKESSYKVFGNDLTPEKCRLLWRCCSKREKLVLSQLVQDGLPNRKNDDALDRLQQRLLVKLHDHRFQIIASPFAEFVRGERRAQEVATLFPPDPNNAWRGLRSVLIYSFILLIGTAVFSVVELLGSPAAGLFTLGTTAIPLVKLAYDLLPGSESKLPLG